MGDIVITRNQYINLLHRMTGYSENTMSEYVKKKKIKDLGKLRLTDIRFFGFF